jgi:hypothetical protein
MFLFWVDLRLFLWLRLGWLSRLSLDTKNHDIEYECRARWDRSNFSITISKLWWCDDDCLRSDSQTDKSLIPSLDYLATSNCENEGFIGL